MRELGKSFVEAVTENPKATFFCLLSTASLFLWSQHTLASKEELAKDIGEIRAQMQQMTVTVSGITNEIRRSTLQTQRRDLNRQIDEIRRLQADGSATERELNRLPLLISDLSDVQDELSRVPSGPTLRP